VVTFSALMEACIKSGQLEKAFSLMKEDMRELQVLPDVYIYSSLVNGCVKKGQLNEALYLVHRMEKEGVG